MRCTFKSSTSSRRPQLPVDCILSSLPDFDPSLAPEELLKQAVEANVRWTMHQILDTPERRERQAEGRVKLVGAIYEIETGRVRCLENKQNQQMPI